MSKIKRWFLDKSIGQMISDPKAKYVLFSDHEAEVKRLEQDINALNEMLRKTGLGQGEIDYAVYVVSLEQQVAKLNKIIEEKNDSIKGFIKFIRLPDAFEKDDLRTHLLEAARAVNRFICVSETMNTAKHHQVFIMGDDEPVFQQRKEWVDYFIEERNILKKAISKLPKEILEKLNGK